MSSNCNYFANGKHTCKMTRNERFERYESEFPKRAKPRC